MIIFKRKTLFYLIKIKRILEKEEIGELEIDKNTILDSTNEWIEEIKNGTKIDFLSFCDAKKIYKILKK